jgi:alkaline phosphatase
LNLQRMERALLLSFALSACFFALSTCAFAQTAAPNVRILLPERTRLLEGQQVDLVLEVRNAKTLSNLSVMAGSNDITSKFSAPVPATLDCNTAPAMVVRANLQSFPAGTINLTVSMNADGATVTDTRSVLVRPFQLTQQRNIVLFIGDAMGTAYRDAARLVARSIVDDKGKNAFRDGFFDDLLEMDKMPVSGMVMTYGTDSVVPDSANTATAWASGNKSYFNALNVFADGTDCAWRFTGIQNASTLPTMLDNPRVENLWQYLRRRYNYRTGIVSTAAITDATPAGEGAYTGYRQSRLEIARQYRENPMLGGRPAFDVMLGGGTDPFTAAGRPDKRDLIGEFQSLGYRYVTNAADLRAITDGRGLLGLFKGSARPAPNSDGIRTASDVNMDVAYDKLGFQRPASEPLPAFAGYTDQPMLDLMTGKAIEVLSGYYSLFLPPAPFILMVEAASIDKQSHPNQAAGQIWDTIEMDKAIGVARAWAAKRPIRDTTVVVTADHDQTMSIIGVSNTPDAEYFDRTKTQKISWNTPGNGDQAITVYGDAYSNARSGVPFINTSTDASNNTGPNGTPGTFKFVSVGNDPAAGTFSTYYGSTAYKLDVKTGYPLNNGAGTRRLAVGYRTGDHAGSSVPVTAEGPGALLFTGYMDQTDLFFKMATVLSTDTTDLDKLLDTLVNSNGRFPTSIGK